MSVRDDLRAMWEAAIGAALPDGRFAGSLPARPAGRTLVLGAGKAAARMAAAFEDAWGPCDGLVVTRYGHAHPTRFVEVVEASHPVPDAAGAAATGRIMELARGAGPDDLVVFLISGGASALLVAPVPGLSLADKQRLNRDLLASGMPIGAMNEVRRCLSAVKGGRLAALAAPARVVTYVISDVPGDAPEVVGSGPTIPIATDPARALALLHRYDIAVPPNVAAALAQERSDAALPVADARVHVLATPMMALEAAAAAARRRGLHPLILGDAIEGEARELGVVLGGIARSVAVHGQPCAPPCVLLSGGEATVKIRGRDAGGGRGRGGRNGEFLLSLAATVGGLEHRIAAIACDTDGIDGTEDNAGALFDEQTARRAGELDLAPGAFLDRNDSYGFFAATGDLVVSGPTHTNVNDFRAIVVR